MPASRPPTQEARLAAAARLREIMLNAAGLHGRQLAALRGWNGAKTLHIVNARAAPSDVDIRTWCQACGADSKAEGLVAANRAVDSMYGEWRRLTRTGLRRLQESAAPSTSAPGTPRLLLPCRAGRPCRPRRMTALLATVAGVRRTPNDIAEVVKACLAAPASCEPATTGPQRRPSPIGGTGKRETD